LAASKGGCRLHSAEWPAGHGPGGTRYLIIFAGPLALAPVISRSQSGQPIELSISNITTVFKKTKSEGKTDD
jgi:hypothetical protein